MAYRGSGEDIFPHVTRPMEPADREIVRQIDRDAFEMLRRNELAGRLRFEFRAVGDEQHGPQ